MCSRCRSIGGSTITQPPVPEDFIMQRDSLSSARVTRAFQTAGTASRLPLEVHVGERLSVGVADDETFRKLLDGPRRREAAGRHFWLWLLGSGEMPDCQKYQHENDGFPAQPKRGRGEYPCKARGPRHNRDCERDPP